MERSATAVVVALLAATLLLTAVLTWQAADAARSHRDTAQRVVRDFSAVGADEFLRRSAGEIETYGFLPLRQAFLNHLNTSWTLPPQLGPSNPDDRLRQALPLAGQPFLVDTHAGQVDPPQLDPALADWLRKDLLSAASAKRSSPAEQVIRVRAGKAEYLIAYGVAFAPVGRMFGFVVNEGALTPFLERSFPRRSVFPPSLGQGRLTNDDIFIEITRAGRRLFRSSGSFHPSVGVARTLGAEYGEVFSGTTVQSSIDPRVAPVLVIGGLPRSRVPLLVSVLMMTAGLIGAAVFLLQRERQLGRLRSDFVSGVSHELRTPLTQIRMFAETLLLDRIRSEEERQRSIEIIDQEARRLAQLVENVLLFSRGDRGVLQLAVGEHDAAAVIRETVEQFMPVASSRGVEVVAEMPPAMPVHIDADAWKQIVLNLLENAVKYGPAGQTVRIRARTCDGMFRMEVDDQGPGIPAGARKEIWRKFVRLERDRGTHKAGTGIGLAVVREIVKLHRGRCWVEDAPRRGARFVVEVPG